MSIYASLAAPDADEHTDECASWNKDAGMWSLSERPCDCGQPDAPLVYHGSNHLPEETDDRGGWVDIATVGKHVRYWRTDPDAPVETEPDGLEPFLRFGVNESTVVLTRRNVQQIHQTLAMWLQATAPAATEAASPATQSTGRADSSTDDPQPTP